MEISRRRFLTMSGAIGSGIALSSLGLDLTALKAHAAELNKMDRIKTARQSTSICCYCSVGCNVICSTDKITGKIINIEGDPDHPINEGSLCAKGAGLFGLTEANEHRLKKVLYRAPKSDTWEEKDWDWTIKRIARLFKDTRDADFTTHTPRASWSTGWSPSAITARRISATRSAGPSPSAAAPWTSSISIIRPASDTARP